MRGRGGRGRGGWGGGGRGRGGGGRGGGGRGVEVEEDGVEDEDQDGVEEEDKIEEMRDKMSLIIIITIIKKNYN